MLGTASGLVLHYFHGSSDILAEKHGGLKGPVFRRTSTAVNVVAWPSLSSIMPPRV
jgi:hypothetical protein